MPLLALKIDVDTFRGTREGVPRLLDALARHGANATFLFSLGPDHTGRAIGRVFRPGFIKKVQRTSVVEHYGIKTLLYGTLLPGPDIGVRCANLMREVRGRGFEVGVHTWDHIAWQDKVVAADAAFAHRHMERACSRFAGIFGEPARVHGAAGWQMGIHALRETQRRGFDYCSDSRGTHPFWPVVNAEVIDCPQLPTTLPTLDELIGTAGLTPDNVHEHLLELTRQAPPHGHIFTLHAELEGMKLLPTLERLLEGFKAQGYQLVATRSMFDALDLKQLPYCEMIQAEVPGRSGTLAVQGKDFLQAVAA